jgi:hypothetical protein
VIAEERCRAWKSRCFRERGGPLRDSRQPAPAFAAARRYAHEGARRDLPRCRGSAPDCGLGPAELFVTRRCAP